MLADERQALIAQDLADMGQVSSGALAARFAVSEDTIRRDLRALAAQGICRRIYGGATAPYAGPHDRRAHHLSGEKARLARAAITLLQSDDIILLDSGSTNLALAQAIPLNMRLTVVTNNLAIAHCLSPRPSIRLIVLGGTYDRELGAMLGPAAALEVQRLRINRFFLGSCGVDAQVGVTAFSETEAELKAQMISASSEVCVMATQDKLQTLAPFHVASTTQIHHLVVSAVTPKDVEGAFVEAGVRVHIA